MSGMKHGEAINRLSDEQVAMKRQDRQPVGVDKRPETYQ